MADRRPPSAPRRTCRIPSSSHSRRSVARSRCGRRARRREPRWQGSVRPPLRSLSQIWCRFHRERKDPWIGGRSWRRQSVRRQCGRSLMLRPHNRSRPCRRRATGPGSSRSSVSGSGHRGPRSSLPPLHRLQHVDQAAPFRHAVGRRSGMERRRPLPRVERHPEQRADALDRRGREGDDVPQSGGLQQREHVRLRGPAAVVRARRAARGPLRSQRHGHGRSPRSSRASD